MVFSSHLAFALLSVLQISDVFCADAPLSADDFLVGDEEVNAARARRMCQEKSMKLLSIENAEKNKLVDEMLNERAETAAALFELEVAIRWKAATVSTQVKSQTIGFPSFHGINKTLWTSGKKMVDDGSWTWVNGEKITYTNWGANEPNSNGKNQDCIEISLKSDGMKWNDQTCNDKRGYICEKGSAADDPKSYQQKEYYLSKKKATRDEAVEECEELSMVLASINEVEENEDLYELMMKKGSKVSAYWISGVRLADNTEGAQLANLSVSTKFEKWRWLKEVLIKYFNWGKKEPNGSDFRRNCIEVYIEGDELLWNDHHCSTNRKYVCEKSND